ncbi:hypothetical protein EJ03DRAFT_208155 [Teratosphaeria nubilosa]|uniref:SMP domain-containing protein n=1 Tax=Teratosphaeria nubilosa TaxID=161662 RepID=A0A6G1KYQ3_9PEZI|nr:hypothetical protein EJ03DRAFT_208155 [Teratosphaeria nubilosa]
MFHRRELTVHACVPHRLRQEASLRQRNLLVRAVACSNICCQVQNDHLLHHVKQLTAPSQTLSSQLQETLSFNTSKMAGAQGFETTKEDVRRQMHDESNLHPGGDIPKGSSAAAAQSLADKENKSKPEIIGERQANLPLPEQPPNASDFNSADARTVNVGSGGVSDDFSYGNDSLREPATGDSAVRTDGASFGVNTTGQGVGREAAGGLSGLPNDAVAREAKGAKSTTDTTNKDYGYPQKKDPADTSKMP